MSNTKEIKISLNLTAIKALSLICAFGLIFYLVDFRMKVLIRDAKNNNSNLTDSTNSEIPEIKQNITDIIATLKAAANDFNQNTEQTKKLTTNQKNQNAEISKLNQQITNNDILLDRTVKEVISLKKENGILQQKIINISKDDELEKLEKNSLGNNKDPLYVP
jgi:hypothetical protein